MAVLGLNPRFEVRDINGDPVAGAKVYTYIAGTTTPKATYTDSTEGTPNANPVICDAEGRADIWLLTDELYKLSVYDADDVLMYTRDNIRGLAGGITIVSDSSPELGGTLENNGFNIAFNDNTGIQDSNGNEQVIFQETTSAKNHIDITNAITTEGPTIGAAGDDTNIDLNIKAKGTGAITIVGASTSLGEIRFKEDSGNGTNYVGIKAPAAVTTDTTLVLPDGDGAAEYLLKTDGSNNLGWTRGDISEYLLETQTALSDSSLDFTTGIDDTYTRYTLKLININAGTTGSNLILEMRDQSTGLWVVVSYRSLVHSQVGATISSSYGGADTAITLATNVSNTSSLPPCGTIDIMDPFTTGRRTTVIGEIAYVDNTAGTSSVSRITGANGAIFKIDGLRIRFSSGVITAGTASLYASNT